MPMSDTSPQIVPLGSLSEAALLGAQLAEEEQSLSLAGPGSPILTGYVANP
jgi:hypothetical protein